MADLKQGDRGMDVKRVQMLLNAKLTPSPRLSEDGDFGAATFQALRRFQSQRGLSADGVVGPRTWAALGQLGKTTAAAPQPLLGSWLDVAKAEVGIHENALPGQHTERIIEYHKTTTLRATEDETPWCSSFVNWVMIKSGRKGTSSAAAKSWLDWGVAPSQPREGAIAVIKRKKTGHDAATGSSSGFHVGFYISSSATHVRLLGGNQSDQVKYSNFALAAYEVKGYRWPA